MPLKNRIFAGMITDLNTLMLDFIRAHENEDPLKLLLQSHRYTDIDMVLATRQIAARQRLKTKIPTFHDEVRLLYTNQLSLEQASSEVTAKHKATLVGGHRFIDLTGGLGVDFFFMAQQFNDSIYVERQEELCQLAAYNFNILGLKGFTVEHDDALNFINRMPQADVVYIDPHRRNLSGKKTILIADCEPDLTQIQEVILSNCRQLLVKLSPMLDLHKALRDLPGTIQVDIVAVENECKEILFMIQSGMPLSDTTPSIRCFNYLKNGAVQEFRTNDVSDTHSVKYASTTETYFYEPNSAIMKSGNFNSLAERFQLLKMHPNTHLYTSATLHENFPGRIFIVDHCIDFSKQMVRELTTTFSSANISVRNFPMSADELRKRSRLKDGGDVYMFAFRAKNDKLKVAICKKVKLL
jgi:16S rRNA G966 N2-methylase RsmD